MNILFALLLCLGAWFLYSMFTEHKKNKEHQRYLDGLSPEDRANYEKKAEDARFVAIHGPLNPELICPHCQSKGTVHSKYYSFKTTTKGKVGGVLKTDIKIDKVESGTLRYCINCKSNWTI